MLMVNALAGTGKTSTGVLGLGVKKPNGMKLSDEQKAIIRIMRGCRGSIAAQAFNKSIAIELSERAPRNCVCKTSNAFGHGAWAKHIDSNPSLDNLKIRKQCREIVGTSLPWKDRMKIETAVDKIVSLCKCYLFDPTSERETNWISGAEYRDGVGAMRWLCDRFDIDSGPDIFEYAQKTFTKGINSLTYIDFNDQNFLPIYHQIDLPTFGHLLIDEVQDCNRAKIAMAFMMAEELTAIGDVNQAIYGFSGADSDAMENMWNRMKEIDSNAKNLPLTITRRCPKEVVRLANTIVPDLRCPDDAPDGRVYKVKEGEFVSNILGKEPSMVICRINAPLTSLAFKMIARGQRCYIQGRDIGSGIKSEVKKTGESDLRLAIRKVNERIENRKMDLMSRDFPDDNQVEALNDKLACIHILAADADNVQEFCNIVDGLFKDSGSANDTRLSSVHKAKGLEHRKVFIYKSNKLRLNVKQQFQKVQENNLAYVAYTRSMDELGLVEEDSKDDE